MTRTHTSLAARRLAILLVCLLLAVAKPSHAQDVPTLSDKPTPRALVETFGQAYGAAAASSARNLLPQALSLIKSFEGWFPNFYNDPAGYCTIGYGRLIALRPCNEDDLALHDAPLSESDGEKLLQEDTIGSRLDVQRLVVATQLSPEQFGALTSFVFNVGPGNFASSTMLRRLNDTSVDEQTRLELASREFPRWVRAGGMVLNGLIARRSCERALFDGQLRLSPSGDFDRSLCDALGAAPANVDLVDIQLGEGSR